MAFDEATISVKGGDGGNGMSHFRHEKFMPRGGPDGGDGGKGGDVVFIANPHLNTLVQFSRQHHFAGENGKRGGTNNKTGAGGDDRRVEVPIGTIIRDAVTGEALADLTEPGQNVVVARGGRGGRGNQNFATSANQAPQLAFKGEPGQVRTLALELKLIADVGIVGVPNAGKSTLLAAISKATPKIAAYPFTTLEPNLGVVVFDDRDLVVADIPGLVEGAHRGIGLGHSFLRHIQRTRLLIHLLDGGGENPLADFSQINSELALFDEHLAQKPQIIVLNKLDLPEAQAHWAGVKRELETRGYEVFSISAATHLHTRELMGHVLQRLNELPPPAPIVEMPVYGLGEDPNVFKVSRDPDGSFRVSGERIERAAKMTYWEIDESAARFQRILAALGISKALEAEGIQVGDTVYIGEYELEWGE
ncbi:MAG: GTPase ObgE [Aggregatilineales bacterium]